MSIIRFACDIGLVAIGFMLAMALVLGHDGQTTEAWLVVGHAALVFAAVAYVRLGSLIAPTQGAVVSAELIGEGK